MTLTYNAPPTWRQDTQDPWNGHCLIEAAHGSSELGRFEHRGLGCSLAIVIVTVQGVYLFQQVQKKQRGWLDFENTMKKKVFQVVSSIFHYLSFLFFWWVEIWSWWVDWVDEKMFFLGRIHNCFLLEISGSLVGLVVCFPGIALTTFPEFPRNSAHNIPWIQRLVVFSNIFFCHPEIWGWNDPIWRAYFSNGLVQPTTRFRDLKSRMPRFFMFPFFPDLKKKNSSKVLEISLKNFSVKGLWFGSHECFCELLSRPTSTMFFNTPLRRCLTNCLDAPNSSKLFGCQQRSQVLKGTWNLSSFYFWFQDDFTLRLGLRWRRQGGKLIHYGFSPVFRYPPLEAQMSAAKGSQKLL